jgi:hypothetical protein
MEHTTGHRLHIAQATDWKDAVITLLEPRSPYDPWRYGTTEAAAGDTVAYVLNTDPPTMLADVGHLVVDGHPRDAIFERDLRQANLVELSTLAKVLDLEPQAAASWSFEEDEALRLEEALGECRYWCAPESRFGHTTMAAARTLLRFAGLCDGCELDIDLTDPGARDELFAHTVDPSLRLEPGAENLDEGDWPAVICVGCQDRMRSGGYARFTSFKFAQNPACPRCGARRTSATFYGLPSDFANIEPWWHAGGCCPTPERWNCGVCYHNW